MVLFIEDCQGDLYRIEPYYDRSYLDKMIRNQYKPEFHFIGIQKNNIAEHEKEYWDDNKVKEFIEQQSPFW